jgi:phytoene desaturase
MSMIPHLEMHYGTFLPEKGMHDISQSLTRLAKSEGVVFHLNEAVDRIDVENGKAVGVQTQAGAHTADLVVSNMDVLPTYRRLLPDQQQPEAILARERSGSALIFYWGIRRAFPELDLHNIFFSSDYRAEFEAQFEGELADDLTVYVNITSKDLPGDAPEGCENWFVMVNAPSDTGQDWQQLRLAVRERILQKLSRNLNVDIASLIAVEEILDPPLIQQRTSSHQGSLYGTSSNSRFAAFMRHPNFTSRIRSLYFCGGSVHPGGGIPLCLYSAKIVADQIPDVR